MLNRPWARLESATPAPRKPPRSLAFDGAPISRDPGQESEGGTARTGYQGSTYRPNVLHQARVESGPERFKINAYAGV